MAEQRTPGVVTKDDSPRVVRTEGTNSVPAQKEREPQSVRKEQEMDSQNAAPPKPRQPRHAHLFVTHLDLWSVTKNAFMFAVAVGIVMIIAVMVIWTMLSLSGTLASLTRTISEIFATSGAGFNADDLFPFSRVVGTTALLAGIEVILVTAFITLFAYLYNLAVGITGGVQITLTDDT